MSEVNGVEPKKVALLALNWRNSGSNGVEPEKKRRWQRWTGKTADLTALNRK